MEKSSKDVTDFCDWVADRTKIPTGQDVRKLRDIFENEDVKNAFVNKGFDAAIQILAVRKPYLVNSFYKDIESVIEGLKDMSTQELDEIINQEDSGKEKMMRDLATWSAKVVKMIEKEKNGV
jgi:DNA-binding ferritin-like protein